MNLYEQIEQVRRVGAAATEQWHQGQAGVPFEDPRDLSSTRTPEPGVSHDVARFDDAADAAFAALARTQLPAFAESIGQVLDLHAEVCVYELDPNTGRVPEDEADRTIMARLCAECSDEDTISSIEDCEYDESDGGAVFFPCATVEALGA